jgi:hypothetical protein
MQEYVFDIETDGLLDDLTKIHVLSYTADGLTVKSIHDYQEMREFLSSASVLIGHNVVRFDVRALEKVLGIKVKAQVYDTLPLAWYLDHEESRFGLEIYGEKFGVKKPYIEDWGNLTQAEYTFRCESDVQINYRLWGNLRKRLNFLYEGKEQADRFLRYLTFKMQCAAYQEEAGWPVDLPLVERSIETLLKQQGEKVEELKGIMPPRQLFKRVSRPKNLFKKDGTPSVHGQRWFETLDSLGLDRLHEEDVIVPNGTEPPNPNSSDQVKDWLFSMGWQPCTFDYKKNDDGSERAIPQIRDDGELTESVKLLIDKHPGVAILDGLTVIQHRLSIFKAFKEGAIDGKLRAEIGGLTNTLRFKHSKPLVNLPGVDKPWGKEIRGALLAPEGHVLCGTDMVSLEATTKRHYMFPYDPDYVAEMSVPGFDEHLDLARFAGKVSSEDISLYVENKNKSDLSHNLATIVAQVAGVRKVFKPVNYSAVYGVGKAKLSRTTGMPERQCQELLDAYWERNWSIKRVAADQRVRKLGGQMWLYNPVSMFWISLRYEKDIFSSLNQSTGVFCFDSWLARCWVKSLKGIGQFHDEVIVPVPKGSEERTKKLMFDAIEAVNKSLNLNVPLAVEPKFGSRYSDVH